MNEEKSVVWILDGEAYCSPPAYYHHEYTRDEAVELIRQGKLSPTCEKCGKPLIPEEKNVSR